MSNKIPLHDSALHDLIGRLRNEYRVMEQRLSELLEAGSVDSRDLEDLAAKMGQTERMLRDALQQLARQVPRTLEPPAPLAAVDVQRLNVVQPQVLDEGAKQRARQSLRRAAITSTIVVRMRLDLPTDNASVGSALAIGDLAAKDLARFQIRELRANGLELDAEKWLRREVAGWRRGAEIVDIQPGSIQLVVAVGSLVALLGSLKPYLVPILVDSGLLKEVGKWPTEYLRRTRRAIFKAAERRGMTTEVTREAARDSDDTAHGGPPAPPSPGESRVRIADGVAGELDVNLRRIRVGPGTHAEVEDDMAAVGEELRLRESDRKRLS